MTTPSVSRPRGILGRLRPRRRTAPATLAEAEQAWLARLRQTGIRP